MSKDILSGSEYTFAIIDELAFKESEKMERKFKVGDEVKIIKVTPAPIGSERAKEYIGKKGKVTEVYGNHYLLDLDEGKFKWYEDELELVKFTPKSLLKDGVVATMEDGIKRVLFDGNFIRQNFGKVVYISAADYDDNNKHDTFSNFDIIKLEFDGEVIWERPKDIIVNFIDSSGNAKPSDIANILEKIKAFAKENNITKATIEIREEDE